MPYIEAAGARLHVEEHGDGNWPVEAAHHPLIASIRLHSHQSSFRSQRGFGSHGPAFARQLAA